MAEKKTAKGGGEEAVLAKIAAMPAPFNDLGKRVHAVIMNSAPTLQPALWYGMPGYVRNGKTVCFFRADKKYMTFGFTQDANVVRDESAADQLIESAWYFGGLDDATEARLAGIVRTIAE